MNCAHLLLLAAAMGAALCGCVCSAELPPFQRASDVIYGRKFGTALTLDVLSPEKKNGAGVVYAVSGGWFSAHEMISPEVCAELLRRGYVVFAVVHGSQPRFTIPEAIEDMHRAVRFVRSRAKDYGIDPQRIGITGGSAGGHLSLMIAMAGRGGNTESQDPVERQSSRVQAVACFFPPTDFLNYGRAGRDVSQALKEELSAFKAPFDFVEPDAESGRFLPVSDTERRKAILRDISPITHVSADDPPALMIHGDADTLVPIQQSQEMEKVLRAAGVPVKLVVKKGQGHGWEDWIGDMALIADWFDEHLKAKG